MVRTDGRTDGRVVGHVITKISQMGRLPGDEYQFDLNI